MPDLRAKLRQDKPIPLDAALTCVPGEVLALVGPSGSGKSTILRAIAGLNQPREGKVAVGDDVWLDTATGISVPTHRRAVGFVFQSYALFPHMTAQANVAAALDHYPDRDRAERARRLLALVHLDGLEGRRPAELSGGQQQRVAVARAIVSDPSIVLADEPTANLDSKTGDGLLEIMQKMNTEKKVTFIFSTHDKMVMDYARRLIMIHDGRLASDRVK
jgi:molybdate transport system ATP-binding protein